MFDVFLINSNTQTITLSGLVNELAEVAISVVAINMKVNVDI